MGEVIQLRPPDPKRKEPTRWRRAGSISDWGKSSNAGELRECEGGAQPLANLPGPPDTIQQQSAWVEAHDALVQSMLRRWREGLRPPALQDAVRDDVPFCSMELFNTAATIAWMQISAEEWGAP